MSLINKVLLSLSLWDEANGLYLNKDLSVVRDPLKKVSDRNEIIKAIAQVAANALSNKTVDSLKTCEKFRKAVHCFKDKQVDLSKDLVDKLDCIISLLFLKAFPDDKESFLTKDLLLSENAADKMSLGEFVDAVDQYVKKFILLRDTNFELERIPEELFLNFNKRVEEFCKDERKAAWFTTQLLPLAWSRWELERNMLEASKGFDNDPESIEGEKLLTKAIKKPTKHEFKLLSHPRDVLFVEKKVYIVLKTLALAKLESAQKINKWTGLGAEIVLEDIDKREKALFLEMKDASLDVEEQQIQDQVNLACINIHKTGPNSFTQTALERIMAYKNNNKDKDLFCERLVDQLAINELMYKHKEADEEWMDLDLPIGALRAIHKDSVTFDKRSYHPYMRLEFLNSLGRVLRKNTLAIDIKKKTPKNVFMAQESKAKLFLEVFNLIEGKVLDETEELFYGVVSQKIECMVKASGKNLIHNLKRYQKLEFIQGDRGDSDFKEYVFEEPTKKAYEAQLAKIKQLKDKLPLTVDVMLVNALKPVCKTESGKPLEDIPVITNASKKPSSKPKKRKIKPSPILRAQDNSENKIKQPESSISDVVSERLSKMSITTEDGFEKSSSAGLGSKVVVKRAAPILPSKASFQYHGRVLRWWKYLQSSPKHPFNNDPKYLNAALPLGPDVKSRIHIEHSLSHLTDRFIERGIQETCEEKLAAYGVVEKVDLVAQIQTRKDDGSVETRNGVIVLSFANIKGKKINIHRSFTDITSEMVDLSTAAAGWVKINQAVDGESAKPGKRAQHYVQDDGSYLESIKDDIVTIADPKNSTTIRIALQ